MAWVAAMRLMFCFCLPTKKVLKLCNVFSFYVYI